MSEPKAQLQICVGQMNSTDSVEKNYEQVLSLLDQIPAGHSPDVVCFPENSLYMRVVEGEKIAGLSLKDEVFQKLQKIAKDRSLNLHFGSVALRESADKLLNATIYISKSGEISISYVKIHLFDIDIPGQKPVRESDVYARGSEPRILKLNGWSLGQSICYDLRFAELYSWYAQRSCEAILIPSSFLVPTGQVHWEIMLRARAIESQAYVIAAAQAGDHHSTKTNGVRQTFGNSMVIDPWGQIIARGQPTGAELLSVTLDLARVQQIRNQIPMRGHRRLISILS